MKQKWYVVAASSIGKSHLLNDTPCQDAFFHKYYDHGWGLAIVCDGAGSAVNSELASAKVAREWAPDIFGAYINRELHSAPNLPTMADWSAFCMTAYETLSTSLNTLAEEHQMSFASLACTMIVIIYSGKGILATHVGDGRAGYQNTKGEWHSVITPHKGEEANQTVFLTSLNWKNGATTLSGVSLPEFRIIKDEITAFMLLSDGCEQHSFVCSVMDHQQQRWTDPNRPYAAFFDPMVKELTQMQNENLGEGEANQIWTNFLTAGTTGLANEPDDKTMILGVLV